MYFQFNIGKIIRMVTASTLATLLIVGVAQAAVTLNAGISSSGGLTVSAGAVSLPAASIADAALSGNVTLLSNTFNGADQLVQLDGTGKLPALDGSALTNLPAGFDGAFSSLSGTPTTLAGYGILDSFSGAYADLSGLPTLFDGAFSSLTGTPTTLAGYGILDAFSGAYADLSGLPTLFSGNYADLSGLPTLFSGNYADLSGLPTLFDGAFSSLSGTPTTLAGYGILDAFSGNYADLAGLPTLFDGAFSSLSGTPTTLAGYGILDAFSGNYADLSGLPTLFSGNYADLSGLPTLFSGNYADLAGKPSLAAVATTGAFADLSGTPTTLAGYGITDAMSTTLSSAKIFVGNGSNVAAPVTMSGDATISNTGVVTVSSGLHAYAMFYGLTAGTGMGGTDYAATVATGAAVPFPQNGPSSGGIVALTNTTFKIPTIGTYEITFQVHTTEPGQLELAVDNGAGFVIAHECTGENMNPTVGGHPIVGSCIITTTGSDAVVKVINPAGNASALTITPSDASYTHTNSQTLIIKKL